MCYGSVVGSYRDGCGKRSSPWWLEGAGAVNTRSSLGLHWCVLLSRTLWYGLWLGDQAYTRHCFQSSYQLKTIRKNLSFEHYCVLGSESSALNKLFSQIFQSGQLIGDDVKARFAGGSLNTDVLS